MAMAAGAMVANAGGLVMRREACIVAQGVLGTNAVMRQSFVQRRGASVRLQGAARCMSDIASKLSICLLVVFEDCGSRIPKFLDWDLGMDVPMAPVCVYVKVWAQDRPEDASVKLIFIKFSVFIMSPFVLVMRAVADIVHT